jgi:5-formyltetrahydrofolate cyclo-ligase
MQRRKQLLRAKYRKIRLDMSQSQVEPYSLIICRKLFAAVEWSKIKSLCMYEPIKALNEIDISLMTEPIEYKLPDIKIHFFGPTKNQKIPKKKFDLIIVPVLAFDSSNNRLGWGGGFYDRFLAQQPRAKKIGVCYQNGFVKGDLPQEPHDISLDQIITEI